MTMAVCRGCDGMIRTPEFALADESEKEKFTLFLQERGWDFNKPEGSKYFSPVCPCCKAEERNITVIFFREKFFYPVEIPEELLSRKHLAEHAALNPGTIRIENTDGLILWREHEADCYAIEAALQAGFEMTNDDGDEFKCTQDQLLAFSYMCERKGKVTK